MNLPLLHILLADDDEDDLYLFSETLRNIGGQVELSIARDGSEVLKKIEMSGEPDIILLDINMPRMNGFECLQVLRDNLYSSAIFLFSTFESEHFVQKAKDFGATGYIKKPDLYANYESLLKELLNTNWNNRLKTDFYRTYDKFQRNSF